MSDEKDFAATAGPYRFTYRETTHADGGSCVAVSVSGTAPGQVSKVDDVVIDLDVFAPGDRVVVVGTQWDGQTGRVVKYLENRGAIPYNVKMDGGSVVAFGAGDLRHVDPDEVVCTFNGVKLEGAMVGATWEQATPDEILADILAVSPVVVSRRCSCGAYFSAESSSAEFWCAACVKMDGLAWRRGLCARLGIDEEYADKVKRVSLRGELHGILVDGLSTEEIERIHLDGPHSEDRSRWIQLSPAQRAYVSAEWSRRLRAKVAESERRERERVVLDDAGRGLGPEDL